MRIIFALCFAFSLSLVSGKDWWEVSAFYQIYPRSFQDSDNDGIGDLNGITQRLPYLKELGINATWLSPIFKSPMADFGYDISSFFEIQPEYGTMSDFENMVRVAKTLGIKIILDFVPNHSSDENEWFLKSANREPGYENFYIWHPGYPDPNNSSKRLLPNNWHSVFRKTGWEWNEKRKEFYLHQFAIQQPDLNYREPRVVETMKSVLRFWLDKGVDGFRVDAVPHLFEIKPDANGHFKDEPVSGLTNDTEAADYLSHIYTQDQNETIDMVYQWRDVLDEYKRVHGGDTRVMLTESYSKIDIIKKYYGDGKGRNGSHIPFNFQLILNLQNSSNAMDFKRIIDLWMNNLPQNRTANWVIGNHDNRRVASRFGIQRIDGITMMIQSLPGASITYNGEEIGMTDVYLTWEETVDPPACNSNPEIFDLLSRDPARTPFQWDDSKNAGFSNANRTWLPVSSNYKTVNVKLERNQTKSHLNIYKELIRLRQTVTFKEGTAETIAMSNNVLGILRKYRPSDDIYITLFNIGGQQETVDLNIFGKLPAQLKYRIVGVNSDHNPGMLIQSKSVTLKSYESFVLQGNLE